MKKSEIIPFGKYKGQPVEILESDPAYTNWLLEQPWFKERYITIYQTVINVANEPTETPEHNAMQVLFLDNDFCKKFLKLAFGVENEIKSVIFETHGVDVLIEIDKEIQQILSSRQYEHYEIELKPTVGDDYPAVLRQIKSHKSLYFSPITRGKSFDKIVGRALFLTEYTGSGATHEQFIKTFEMSGVKVVFRHQMT